MLNLRAENQPSPGLSLYDPRIHERPPLWSDCPRVYGALLPDKSMKNSASLARIQHSQPLIGQSLNPKSCLSPLFPLICAEQIMSVMKATGCVLAKGTDILFTKGVVPSDEALKKLLGMGRMRGRVGVHWLCVCVWVRMDVARCRQDACACVRTLASMCMVRAVSC